MDEKEEKDGKLPVYEVEFIPVERRLRERRGANGNAPVPRERRRMFGRRQSDQLDDPPNEADKPESGD